MLTKQVARDPYMRGWSSRPTGSPCARSSSIPARAAGGCRLNSDLSQDASVDRLVLPSNFIREARGRPRNDSDARPLRRSAKPAGKRDSCASRWYDRGD
jgi:hypothetical protein